MSQKRIGSETEKFQRTFVLLLAIGISIAFFFLIKPFVIALLLAAIFSGITYPLYQRLTKRLGGRRNSAAILTILGVFALVIVPLTAFAGVVVSQAVQVSSSVSPWVQEQLANEEGLVDRVDGMIPEIVREYVPDSESIMAKLGEFARHVGSFVVNSLASATRGTAGFFLDTFVMLYAMFFFLVGGRDILRKVLFYLPLATDQEQRLVERFTSVTRATLRGSLVIGAIQGGLAGLGFLVVGIPGTAIWATVMAILSVIPAVGAALIWVPAVGYLLVTGSVAQGVGLLIWCGAVVGSVDNVLRPALVGRDAKLPDLFILVGTLGGIALFGVVGFILGPVLAALFITVWEIYGETFSDYLPEVHFLEDTDDGPADGIPIEPPAPSQDPPLPSEG